MCFDTDGFVFICPPTTVRARRGRAAMRDPRSTGHACLSQA